MVTHAIKESMPTFRARLAAAAQALRADTIQPASSEPRTDATNTVATTSGAAIENPLSGLGGAQDSGAQSRPNLQRNYLTTEELIALMRGTIYRSAVEVVPLDAMRRGIVLTDATDDPSPLQSEIDELNMLAKVRQAATWGRALGEAYLWPVVEDGGAPLSEPLVMERVTRIYGLQVLDTRDLTPATYQANLRTATQIGLPATYYLHIRRPTVMVPTGTRIHHTRLLRFWGDELPPSEVGSGQNRGLSADAVGQTIWDGLRNLAQTGAAGARLAEELSVAVFYLDNLDAKDAGRGRDLFRTAWTRIMQVKSMANGILLGTKDKAERLPAHAAGFDTLSEGAWNMFQALSRVPAARIRGSSPGGLNTDGDSWQQSYYSDVDAWAKERILPALRWLIRLLYQATHGGPPASWNVEFGPFYHLSPKERAELRLTTAQSDQLALDAGLVTREQVRRSRYGAGGFQLDLQAPTPEDQRELDLAPDDTDPAAAEAVLADLVGAGDPATLTAEQVKLVQDVLANVSAGKLKAPAAEILLAAVLPREQAMALVAAQVGTADAEEGIDAPDLSNQRALAAAMTTHGVERCEHNAVNRCRICGIERDRALVLGADGQPTRDTEGKPIWAVRWRAMGDPDPTPDATTRADADFAGKAMLCIRLSEAGRAAWSGLVQAAEAIVGPLEGYEIGETDVQEPPHVTLLYLGATNPADLPEIQARAAKVVEGFGPVALRARKVGTFQAGPASEGRVPVIAELDAWELGDLNGQLLRALARFVSADQFDRFHAHVTLGFAPTLTPEQIAALAEMLGSAEPLPMGSAAAVDLHHGNGVVARLPMLSKRTDAKELPP